MSRRGPPRARRGAIHVLVVDDSAVVRQVMASVLAAEEDFSVSVAADPLIAIQHMKRRRPDVILLDLALPRMDGLTFLRKLMEEDPIPVVVCAGLAGPNAEQGLRALEEGAVEIVMKPSFGVGEFLRASSGQLVDGLRAAAQARVVGRRQQRTPTPSVPARVRSARRSRPSAGTPAPLVAIGASTGGTEAIRTLLAALPADCPALAVVQHMPDPYTRAFAQRLNALSALEVTQAEEGDVLRPGRALIAPGNRHLRIRRGSEGYVVSLDDGPPVNRHRPSVDVLLHSVAEAAGASAVGVLLTGMGSDGAEGLLELRRRGGATVAQDEGTSIVFGMPREAIERGAAELVLALESIPAAILECTGRRASAEADA
jgi:two-component system chemotaxis response regulator CheB